MAKDGKALSAEHRAAISRGLRGHWVSPDTRIRIGKARKGHPVSAETRAKISLATKGRPSKSAGKFKKGNTPWNKGRYCRLSRATEFKPGVLSGQAALNYRPLGHITIRTTKRRAKKKRRFIKVNDDQPSDRRYIPMAQHIWQLAHGPIPPGKFVVHANGDTMDDDPQNLLLIGRRELLAFQRRINPKIEARRKAGCAKAAAQRSAVCKARKQRGAA